MARRLLKSRLGISIAVSAMIMVTAVATMGTAVTWLSTTRFRTLQEGTGDFYENRANALRESFIIEDVWFKSTDPKSINVTVRNTGQVDINVQSIQVNGTVRWSTGVLLPASSATTITMTYNWTSGAHFFTATTERGTTARATWASP